MELNTVTEQVERISTGAGPKVALPRPKSSNSLNIRESCLKVLNTTIKNQATEAYKTAYTVDDIIDISERLIHSLLNVSKDLGHVFPQSYNIAKIYFYAYKGVVLQKVNPYVQNMDKLIENDKGLLLLLVAFVTSSEEVLLDLQIPDPSMHSLKSKLSKFIPVFLEHIEHLLENCLLEIRRQFYKRYEKLLAKKESNIGKDRESEMERLWTNLPDDIFTFIQKQLDLVAERLSGNNLFEVLKSILSRLTWITGNLCEKAEKVKLSK